MKKIKRSYLFHSYVFKNEEGKVIGEVAELFGSLEPVGTITRPHCLLEHTIRISLGLITNNAGSAPCGVTKEGLASWANYYSDYKGKTTTHRIIRSGAYECYVNK